MKVKEVKVEKVKVKLKKPINFGSEVIEEINFREPKAKDMRKMTFPLSTGDLLDLALQIGDQPKSVMDELSAGDAVKVIDVMANFIEGGQ